MIGCIIRNMLENPITKKARVFSFVGFLVLFHCSAPRPSGVPISSTNLTEALTEKIEPLIEQTMKSYDVPGLALAVAKDGKIVYAKGFGVKDLRSREPITPDSLFHMASVSKTFVATAIVQLLEQGKIQLDDPVRTYLPYFQLKDPRFKQITIRHLLTHTTGLPYLENENRNFDWDRPEYDSGALERYVRRLHEVKMIAAPGEKFSYSDMGFEILGDVIAKVSQQSFTDYVKVHILDPLGMRESNFFRPDTSSRLWTTGHVRGSKGEPKVSSMYPYNRAHGPSSTLESNAIEMCHWAITNLNRGILNGKRILKSSSYELLWNPGLETECGPRCIGLSWFLDRHRDQPIRIHTGGDTGYQSVLILLPDQSAGVVTMSNMSGLRVVAPIAFAVLDVVLGHEPELNIQKSD